MKLKILSFVIVCLFLFADCGTKLDTAKAKAILMNTFEMTKEAPIEISDLFRESENIATFKAEIYDMEMNFRLKKFTDKGWQINEASKPGYEWFPITEIGTENLKSHFKEKRKEAEEEKRARKEQPQMYAMIDSMKDITVISTAVTDYVTDNGITPKQDGNYDRNSSFYKALSPFYVKELPIKDGWGNNYLVYCGKACDEQFGFPGNRPDYFIVVSYGRDGKKEDWKFDPGNPEAGLIEMKTEDDFNIDIIMWKSYWIRAPRSAVR